MRSKKLLMFVLPVIVGILTSLAYGETNTAAKLPQLVDLGASKCIPCKKMAPILEELREEYRGRMDVIFIDVWKNPEQGQAYGIESIPTQIFYNAEGKELFRHEGFIPKEDILAKWSELGVDLSPKKEETSRAEPKVTDTRPADQVCFMCDGTNVAKTLVEVKTSTQPIRFCSIHCYFIYRTSLKDVKGIDEKVSVTDWETGKTLPAVQAIYVVGLDEKKRSVIKAFATKESALKEREKNGGNLMDWSALSNKEQAIRCGFCNRAVYAEDSCRVKVSGLYTYVCGPRCALRLAALMQKDIEVEAHDILTGEIVRMKLTGNVITLEPKTGIVWECLKKNAEGKIVFDECSQQLFFASEKNFKSWQEKNPNLTGRFIYIHDDL
jgi:thiol-disulfide isomerase/thioredoxin